MDKIIIAHLYQHLDDLNAWEIQTNEEHCQGVGEICSSFAKPLGLADWGKILGLIHDRGKERIDFQKYIRITSGYDSLAGKYTDKSHSIIGAALVEGKIGNTCYILSNCIAGHHRGLYDHDTLRVELGKAILPPEVSQAIPKIDIEGLSVKSATEASHLTRVLYSCLVDADYLDTERFMNPDAFSARGSGNDMMSLQAKLDAYLESFSTAPRSPLNVLRTEIQTKCVEAGQGKPGFYELTVPTGGGKTIASVAWALSHAIKHGKRHIIIAIPFTSIIVQTAQVLRNIFGEANVLEHHSVISEDNSSGANKLASENWDAPIVVTTNVQLFESVFSNRPSKCRKLHSLAESVVIFDEPQSLPLTMMQPMINAIKSYNSLFGTSFLFCTASQPIISGVRKGLGMAKLYGIKNDDIHTIIPPSLKLHDRLRRVKISFVEDCDGIESIAKRMMDTKRSLCIVNTRRLAFDLFKALPNDECNVHLSRMMCPAHIASVLADIRQTLSETTRLIRVVSTQLIEAGVDIDFPVVFRQLSGLDSILQAAGRCNREGKLNEGQTFVFDLQGQPLRGSLEKSAYAMREIRSLHPDADWLDPKTMEEYYRVLYSKIDTFDKKEIESYSQHPAQIAYEEISDRFKLIDEDGIPVIVNYGESPALIEQLRSEGPSRALMRRLSMYSVSLRQHQFRKLKEEGLIFEPQEGIYYIEYANQYHPVTGLKTDNEFLDQIYII